MDEITFSVVIPTCDRPHYLRSAIRSVLSQELVPLEIIVVDNGNYPISIEEIPRSNLIRLVRALPRFGVSQARNLGAIISSGEYLAFLDDDDSWSPSYLSELSSTIVTSGSDIVIAPLRNMQTGCPIEGKQAKLSSSEEMIASLLVRNPGVVGSNTTVRRSVFFASSGYDPMLVTGEDKALVLDLLLSGYAVTRSERAWVLFRENVNGERLSHIDKLVKGRRYFVRKYWKIMPLDVLIFNHLKIIKLMIFGALSK